MSTLAEYGLTVLLGRIDALETAVHRIGEKLMAFDAQMSQLKSDLDTVKADLTIAITGIGGLQSQITSLNATIRSLQDQIAAGGLLTPEQQAALDAAVAEADTVKVSADELAAKFPQP